MERESQGAGPKRDAPPARARVSEGGAENVAGPSVVGEGAFIDFAHLKRHLPLTRVLDQLGLSSRLKGSGAQRRGACPLHRGDGRGRTFRGKLVDAVVQCFDAWSVQRGDRAEMWAAVNGLSLR